ncbi:NOP protein chaperone 1 isoform X1 [Lemur catta]|uniref:NOP protein chaperone 1 isoform X1 n=1 Tax=Lemur catta TaxID=9447 RepID=UPI001E267C01|nr:NOP protein chaperone 1 isoform X1 [Lemur catta]
MEVHGESPASPSCASSARVCSGVPVSKELLTAGCDVRGGIWDRLLINSQPNSRKTSTLQTVRIERSPLLDKIQTFLPQMAKANEKLRKEMAAAPPGHFNIENIDGTLGKVIQMLSPHPEPSLMAFYDLFPACFYFYHPSSCSDVALFEMNQSDSKEEDSSEESSQDSSENSSESEDEEDSISHEVTIDNIKLPNSEDGKGKIEVLDSPASKKKK